MRLVDNWKRSHRKYSVQAMAIAASIQGAWQGFSATGLASSLPQSATKVIAYLVMGLLALGIVGSMVDQGEVTEPKQ